MDLLSDSLFARVDKRILRLADDPRPQGCRKLRGQKDIWRIRIGDYRVISPSMTLQKP
jgi:mRNA interferase RelE/StbE